MGSSCTQWVLWVVLSIMLQVPWVSWALLPGAAQGPDLDPRRTADSQRA